MILTRNQVQENYNKQMRYGQSDTDIIFMRSRGSTNKIMPLQRNIDKFHHRDVFERLASTY
jgi:hypothetical protein